jgi:ATP-dependent Clp protease ATP-binding subunit ClpC
MDPKEYTEVVLGILSTARDLAPGQVEVEHLREALNEETETVSLSQVSRELTQEAADGKLDPVIGRDAEIQDLIEIICCRRKNNPVLIGEAGVGKTAIVEGLAQQIVEETVPEVLRGKQVIALDLAMLVGGTKYRGQLEKRVKTILAEIEAANEQIILFIDELHTIVGAGSAIGTLDLSNMLKPTLARGDLRCIGATTFDEYRKYIEKDAALERRFQPVTVKEPSIENTINILNGLKETYEEYHGVQIQDSAIIDAVKLSKRYISNRFLPDKAVEIFDRAASRVKVTGDQSQVNPEDIAEIIERLTDIPVSRLVEDETQRLLKLEEHLREQVIGQDEAVSAVSNAIRRARVGLGDPDRPVGSFLFMGPTGVGKTHLAKSLAEFLFDDANAMVRIDMSEYIKEYAVSRLIGAPPGYIGYDDGGQLTEAVRRKPYCVILLDEIRRANLAVLDVLLQMLDDGRITDGHGRTVDFKNTIVIMTSNIADQWVNGPSLERKEIRQKLMEETNLRREFLNRIDEFVIFNQLDIEKLKLIVAQELKQLSLRFKAKNMTFTLFELAKEELANRGFDPEDGARPLRRTIESDILNPLAKRVLKGEFKEGDSIHIDFKDDDFSFQPYPEDREIGSEQAVEDDPVREAC